MLNVTSEIQTRATYDDNSQVFDMEIEIKNEFLLDGHQWYNKWTGEYLTPNTVRLV